MAKLFHTQLWVMVLTVMLVGFQQDDAKRDSKRQNDRSKAARTKESATHRQAALMEFVQQNHPDLKRLLDLLEKRKPAQFRQAMKELAKHYDRLQAVKSRDAEKYRIALRYWKVHSRIEVMSAQVALKGADKFESKLKELIRQRLEIRIQLREYEEARLQERLNRVQDGLDAARKSMDADVERQLKQILNASRAKSQQRGKTDK